MDEAKFLAWMERQERFNQDMLKIFQQGFDEVKLELRGLRQEFKSELSELKLQQERTNLILRELTKDVEEIKDKLDFDRVPFNETVEMEVDGQVKTIRIRRIRPAA